MMGAEKDFSLDSICYLIFEEEKMNNVIFLKTRMWSAIQNSNPTFEWEFPIHLNPPNTCSSNTASSQVDFSLNLLFQVDFGLNLLFPHHLIILSGFSHDFPFSPQFVDLCLFLAQFEECCRCPVETFSARAARSICRRSY